MSAAAACIDSVYDIVRLLYLDFKAAVRGERNFTLVPIMSWHLVPSAIWSTSTAERKTQLFGCFLHDTGTRQMTSTLSTVTSKDWLLSVLVTPRVARKPGQKSRPWANRTWAVCSSKN